VLCRGNHVRFLIGHKFNAYNTSEKSEKKIVASTGGVLKQMIFKNGISGLISLKMGYLNDFNSDFKKKKEDLKA